MTGKEGIDNVQHASVVGGFGSKLVGYGSKFNHQEIFLVLVLSIYQGSKCYMPIGPQPLQLLGSANKCPSCLLGTAAIQAKRARISLEIFRSEQMSGDLYALLEAKSSTTHARGMCCFMVLDTSNTRRSLGVHMESNTLPPSNMIFEP